MEALAQWLEAEIGQAITEARQGEDVPLVLALEPEHPTVAILAEPPERDYDLLRVTCGFGVVAVSRVF